MPLHSAERSALNVCTITLVSQTNMAVFYLESLIVIEANGLWVEVFENSIYVDVNSVTLGL